MSQPDSKVELLTIPNIIRQNPKFAFIGFSTENISSLTTNFNSVSNQAFSYSVKTAADNVFQNLRYPFVRIISGPNLTIKDLLTDHIVSGWVLAKEPFELMLFDDYYFKQSFKDEIYREFIQKYNLEGIVNFCREI